ncbi:MAG: tRNA ((46)-N7)-methyltransferase TrmB, partial [Bacteroidota bacterium]
IIKEGKTFMQGEWREKFFKNDNPLVIELGCGKGEYTVQLAEANPHINYLGVDVKGHRFNHGARIAIAKGLKNVAFLRTRVEFIESFFGPNEVDEIWLTFSDPQPKDETGIKRITSSYFWNKYRNFLKPNGTIHIKHDNPMIYWSALEELEASRHILETHSADVYGDYIQTQPEEWQRILSIRTFYESRWLGEGKKIHYVRFRTQF